MFEQCNEDNARKPYEPRLLTDWLQSRWLGDLPAGHEVLFPMDVGERAVQSVGGVGMVTRGDLCLCTQPLPLETNELIVTLLLSVGAVASNNCVASSLVHTHHKHKAIRVLEKPHRRQMNTGRFAGKS